jgi:hypothetical protein
LRETASRGIFLDFIENVNGIKRQKISIAQYATPTPHAASDAQLLNLLPRTSRRVLARCYSRATTLAGSPGEVLMRSCNGGSSATVHK